MNVGKYKLDKEQEQVVLSNNNYTLVVAGAGSGKTLTIVGKIKYLVLNKRIKPDEIICVSFTNAAVNSLKEKIKKEIDADINVYTFHKLALTILKNKYKIADSNTLDYVIDDYFLNELPNNKKLYKYLNVKNEREYYEALNKNKVIIIKKTIATFIHLFKSSGYEFSYLEVIAKKIKKFYNFNYRKEKTMFLIITNVYYKYEKYLNENNEIDFDDMIIMAYKKVKKEFNKKIKFIIIDEYQDTSIVKLKLIKAIIEKTNAKLLVVGDDFQSIYRFTGSDINLFLEFGKYFDGAKIMKIRNTYRNSYELIKIAGKFIMGNKHQIKKELCSEKRLKCPIEIIEYKNKNEFKDMLSNIDNKGLLVLGRNNDDIYEYIDNDFKEKDKHFKYKNIEFDYMTIHKSKGLESENVVIIGLGNNLLDIPSKIKNDRIIRYVQNNAKNIEEERRLFYVALTRTKNRVYLFTPMKNKSIFVKEIKRIIDNML